MAAASPATLLQPSMMDSVLIYAFAAAVLGGLESPVGALVGGLTIGVFLNLIVGYVNPSSFFGKYIAGSELQLPLAFAVLLLILLVKPSGLFGRGEVRRV
jgi:branched-chain amino acid transport system permease protein